MKKVYSQYWMTARERIYGFGAYDKALCSYITQAVSSGNLLEVAVGTGFPFADFFRQRDYCVSGVDIAKNLISKCAALHPDVRVCVGDAEDLCYRDGYFDCVYCFH